jgi:hypothetical protein
MPVILRHDNVTFEDQTIYLTGSAYIGCTFRRCTLVLMGFPPPMLDNCTIDSCVFHLNLVISDVDQANELRKVLEKLMIPSLPRTEGRPTQP